MVKCGTGQSSGSRIRRIRGSTAVRFSSYSWLFQDQVFVFLLTSLGAANIPGQNNSNNRYVSGKVMVPVLKKHTPVHSVPNHLKNQNHLHRI